MKLEGRSWPGFADWALALATTVLAATEFQVQGMRTRVQSKEIYYFEQPGINALHTVGIAIDIAVFVVIVLWFVTRRRSLARPTLFTLAVAGFAACWTEIVVASKIRSSVFVLESLPFYPVCNYGLIGAQVFGTYLIFCLPTGKGRPWPMAVSKVALAVCLYLAQTAAWSVLS